MAARLFLQDVHDDAAQIHEDPPAQAIAFRAAAAMLLGEFFENAVGDGLRLAATGGADEHKILRNPDKPAHVANGDIFALFVVGNPSAEASELAGIVSSHGTVLALGAGPGNPLFGSGRLHREARGIMSEFPMIKPRITLYSRPGCHLCEEMKRAIAPARKREAFDWEEVDIDGDPELVSRYGESIPVLAINGKVAFKVRLTLEEFLVKFQRIVTDPAGGASHG